MDVSLNKLTHHHRRISMTNVLLRLDRGRMPSLILLIEVESEAGRSEKSVSVYEGLSRESLFGRLRCHRGWEEDSGLMSRAHE